VEQVLDARTCDEWRQRALQVLHSGGLRISRAGGGAELRYRVANGELIQREWPELFELYCGNEIRDWVKAITGAAAVFLSPHTASAVNVNLLGEPGEIYRWHFDATPFTTLLYLTSSTPEDGGALQMSDGQPSAGVEEITAHVESFYPRAGTMLLMDGTRCYHRVAPVLRPHIRLSIPMVFPPTATHERPVALDSYLYAAE
jgi:hypothetical protein